MEQPEVKVRALADRLIVKQEKETDSRSKGGLILPVTAKDEEAANVGVVVRVSHRVENPEVEEDAIHVGDRILYSKFAGTPFTYGKEDYKMLRITDLLGVIEE